MDCIDLSDAGDFSGIVRGLDRVVDSDGDAAGDTGSGIGLCRPSEIHFSSYDG
jgi:hypothetical protein